MTIISITAQEVSANRLKDLFKSKADGLTKIEFIDCILPELDEDLFEECKKVTKIKLNGCKLSCLPAKLFRYTEELKYLNLSRNEMTRLDDRLFEHCLNLEHLDLSHNKLHQLNQSLLNNCKKLNYLNLSNNMLSYINNDFFSEYDHLVEINLANNSLTHLNVDLFNNCYNLAKLDLSNNSLANLNDQLLIQLEDQRRNGINFLIFQLPGTQVLLIFKIRHANNKRDDLRRTHLLHWAIMNENFEIIKQFFESVSELEFDIEKELLKFLDRRDENGQTALHLAVQHQNIETIKLLIDAKANLNLKDNQENSVLHTAILNEKTSNLHFILSYLSKNLLIDKIDLDLKNENGKTAFHLAAEFGDLRAINLLSYYGGSINMLDNFKKTPLDYALDIDCQIKRNTCVETLISCGSDCISHQLLVKKQDKSIIRNLIFEGGGIKGIAYVGALKQAMDSKSPLFDFENIINIGGTSAGAITATLLALDYKIDEINTILFDLHLSDFLDSDHKDTFLKFKDKIKNKNLSFSILFRMVDLVHMRNELDRNHGLFPGETFRLWIDELITKKLGENATFKDLQTQIEAGKKFKFLYLVGSNLTTGDYETFSHLDTPDMIIADAVRISMSIPLVWYPHKYYIKNENNQRVMRSDKKFYNYVDGGLLLNYPITLFDKRLFSDEGEFSVYNNQTLGFRLTSRLNIYNKIHEDEFDTADGFYDYIFRIFNLYYNREEITHSKRVKDQSRTVYIDTLGLSALDFDLSKETMLKLIANGEKAVRDHLASSESRQSSRLKISPYLYGCLMQIYADKIDLNQFVRLTSSKLNHNSSLVPSIAYEFFSKGSEKEIEYLRDLRIDIAKTDDNGNNVLHLAALKSDFESVKKLKDYINELNVRNNSSEHPIDIARKFNDKSELVTFLAQYEARN